MIKRISLREQIFDELINIFKQYKCGDKLPPEAALSEKLGVSRNSIREAMKSLAIAGIVQPQAGKGTFLLKDIEDISATVDGILNGIESASYHDLLEVRGILEVEVAGLAAERADKMSREYGEFEKAWSEFKETMEAGDLGDTTTGKEFHRALAALAGNKIIVKLLENINKEDKAFREATAEKGDLSKELVIHEKIYRAVADGDVLKAKEAMKEHMRYSQKVLDEYL